MTNSNGGRKSTGWVCGSESGVTSPVSGVGDHRLEISVLVFPWSALMGLSKASFSVSACSLVSELLSL